LRDIVDVHVHLPTKEYFAGMGEDLVKVFLSKIDKIRAHTTSVDGMLVDLDQANIKKAVVLGWDAETNTGVPAVPNDYIASIVDKYPDRFIGFASVDPHKGLAAVRELDRARRDLHLSGLKLHTIFQGFYPNDKQVYPLYEKCVELGIPLLIHTGWEYMGVGFPGGRNLRQKFGRPIYIDDVAADFPDLRIIMAHPAWPWEDEQFAIVMQKDNVYLDLAGWMPKFYSGNLRTYLKIGAFNKKCMFGSDYPFLDVVRVLNEFSELDLTEEVKKRILVDNATNFFDLQS
jgi:uncharacterized protein